jgi:putative DNA primase/helicase
MEFTDSWAAEGFANKNGEKARWVPEWKKWVTWDEGIGIWREDGSGDILRLAVDWVKGRDKLRRIPAVTEGDTKFNERLWNWMVLYEGARRLGDMCNLAKSRMTTRINEFDSHSWKLNILNGVIDFETGKFTDKHDPKLLMTKIAPVRYEKGEELRELCPEYMKFLDEVMLGRGDLVLYLQKVFGSCMVGKVLDRAFYVWVGAGRNGKTTLANCWMGCLGNDYAIKLPFHTFTKSRYDDGRGPTPDLHRLRGARMAVASEGEEDQRLAMSRLKELTGKTPISVNPKNKDQYDFVPQATYILDTNKVPDFDGTDVAMMDRLKVVPFDKRIDDEMVNLRLDEVLEKERDGIFKWGAEGCLRWKKEGMADLPESMVVAIELQKQENDPVGVFLASGVVEGFEGAQIGTKQLYDAYILFAQAAGLYEMKNDNFRKRMKCVPRFVEGIQVERLEKIFGTKGGGYANIQLAENEVDEIRKREEGGRTEQGKFKFEGQVDDRVGGDDDDFDENVI